MVFDVVLAVAVALALVILGLWVKLQSLSHQLAATVGHTRPIKVTEPTAAELETKLRSAYEAEIAKATQTFGTDLADTSQRLSEQVSRLTTDVIEKELAAYHDTLDGVRQTANEAMERIRAAVEEQRLELKKGMEADLAAERQRLIERFDAKLGDVVGSYIAESLGGGVDLGAQMQFIVTSLEAHKADIKKDLGDV
jgi:F0F1-type ATP synthase membrane subunit b/b'